MFRYIISGITTAGLTLAVIIMALSLTGCAAPSAPARPRLAMTPNLLFDQHPGSTYAHDVRRGRTWPSAAAGAMIRERIQFTDRVYDFQGRNLGRFQDYQRNFQSRRIGVIER